MITNRLKQNTNSILLAGLIALGFSLGTVEPGAAHDRGHKPRMSFEELDQDANGSLSIEELRSASEGRFTAMDTDEDGLLSAEEIKAAAEGRRARRIEHRIERMFERRDENGDGLLSMAELTPSQERLEARFSCLDGDGDGLVTEAEFDAERGHCGRGRGHGHGSRDSDN